MDKISLKSTVFILVIQINTVQSVSGLKVIHIYVIRIITLFKIVEISNQKRKNRQY